MVKENHEKEVGYADAVYHINELERYFLKNGSDGLQHVGKLKELIIKTKVKKSQLVMSDFVRKIN